MFSFKICCFMVFFILIFYNIVFINITFRCLHFCFEFYTLFTKIRCRRLEFEIRY
ncbi:hypothetical protein GLOIN_2v1689033 [Rhizophagus irregularis DAOM 181602=DAOM 197198]|uniref:Uncharacterized protein n=1 Tax=Rhizophagus irregularis (strain DAOM 181602 / DAOM 197198 / MUCL 43194) TaxID=747089 RepID=A0A2P4PCN3_RHIID|nr:hypothetical protein GLOIN_2v1689033 [Rhizophagus irregularis DAOM 181602=DAOM 197198]POG63142.1 hypothetical protein GLOIN_2v1689033 [Rhizophagus irregularis DAOM 181602=DAOM 197198]|eukprot:XP_025170008.1 hypothetical protein GLOIN_2v1689033 [Rhizophagus irregularis DAOM 181602=DAOM 197198]